MPEDLFQNYVNDSYNIIIIVVYTATNNPHMQSFNSLLIKAQYNVINNKNNVNDDANDMY